MVWIRRTDARFHMIAAGRAVERKATRIESTMRNPLDSISPATRDLIEERLVELRKERERLAVRSEELDRMAAQQGEVRDIAHDIAKFLATLPWTLREGVPAERLTALRRCIEGITIDRPSGTADIRLRPLPSPMLAAVPSEAVRAALPEASSAPKSERG